MTLTSARVFVRGGGQQAVEGELRVVSDREQGGQDKKDQHVRLQPGQRRPDERRDDRLPEAGGVAGRGDHRRGYLQDLGVKIIERFSSSSLTNGQNKCLFVPSLVRPGVDLANNAWNTYPHSLFIGYAFSNIL
jgi:hypothetical protein